MQRFWCHMEFAIENRLCYISNKLIYKLLYTNFTGFFTLIIERGDVFMSQNHNSKNKSLEVFLWGSPKDKKIYNNLSAFAARHNISMIKNARPVNTDCGELQNTFEKTKKNNIFCWLGTGVFHRKENLSDRDLIEKPEKAKIFIKQLKKLVEIYNHYYPEGRVILWHEDPLYSKWTGSTYKERIESMSKYGPDIFKMERDAIKEINPKLQVGIFLHHPQVASEKFSRYTVFGDIMSKLKETDSLPDFTFMDMYRGYYEVRVGTDITNKYLYDLITNAKKHTLGRPVYYLGEDHTIKTGYTPSKKSIRDTVRTAVKAGADGIGWYMSVYGVTTQGFDSFLPNHNKNFRSKNYNEFTGFKDRYLYSFYSLLEEAEKFDPDDKFDIWIYGDDFNFYENSLYLQNQNGDWEFIGDFSGYMPGNDCYDMSNKTAATVFHCLDRKRFLGHRQRKDKDDFINIKIKASNDSNGSKIKAIFAMPYFESAVYKTDFEATKAIESNPVDIRNYSLGSIVWPKPVCLKANDSFVEKIELTDNARLGIIKKDLELG